MGRWLLVGLLAVLAACSAHPADRASEADRLTQQIRAMPAVLSANSDVAGNVAQGPVSVQLSANVADGVTGDQAAAIVSRYLDGLHAGDYAGYRVGLEIRRGTSVFTVDSVSPSITNGEEIVSQARSWTALREQLPGAAVTVHAAVAHPAVAVGASGGPPSQVWPPDSGHRSSGAIQLGDSSDYTAVTAAVSTLASNFAQLAGGDWTISAGREHPAEVKTSKRLPAPLEMDVWAKVNADQAIAHADVLVVNGNPIAPVWISEKTRAHDVGEALRLAQAHLPIAATLPAPVLYTATDQYQGRFDFNVRASGPVAVAIAGCVARTYVPGPAEEVLIATYERCRH